MGIIFGTQTGPCYLNRMKKFIVLAFDLGRGRLYLFLEIPSHEFTNHFVLFEEACGDFAKRINEKFLSSSFNPQLQISLIEEKIERKFI